MKATNHAWLLLQQEREQYHEPTHEPESGQTGQEPEQQRERAAEATNMGLYLLPRPQRYKKIMERSEQVEQPATAETVEAKAESTAALAPLLEHLPGYLSIHEAAQIMGVSERSVYGYVANRKLNGYRAGSVIVVEAGQVAAYQRAAPGRKRTLVPGWHQPPAGNQVLVTTVTVRARPGQSQRLDELLAELRRNQQHCFPGTAARSITRNQGDAEEIEIRLLWRSLIMPSEEEREAALAALAADLADVLDWETAVVKYGQVLLHA